MRILFTIYKHLGGGGAAISAFNLARELRALGHDIMIASTEISDEFKTHLLPEFRPPLFGLHHGRVMRRVARIIGDDKVDIVHCQDRLTSLGGIWASKRMRVPVVVHFRDQWFCCPRSVCVTEDYMQYDICSYGLIWRHFPKRRIPWEWYKWYCIRRSWEWLRSAEAKIAVSRLSQRKLRLIGVERGVHIVYNSRDLRRYASLPRGHFRKHPGEILIGLVGDLTYIRGGMSLVQAARILLASRSNVRFLIVGNGDMRQKMVNAVMANRLSDHFVFTGKIPNESIPEVYGDTDIVVFPTMIEEPFSGTLVEAMASGIPVVASHYGGNLEAIDDGRNGFLIDPKNAEEFAQRLDLLIRDGPLRSRMSRYAREKALQFSNRASAEKVSRIYADLRSAQ